MHKTYTFANKAQNKTKFSLLQWKPQVMDVLKTLFQPKNAADFYRQSWTVAPSLGLLDKILFLALTQTKSTAQWLQVTGQPGLQSTGQYFLMFAEWELIGGNSLCSDKICGKPIQATIVRSTVARMRMTNICFAPSSMPVLYNSHCSYKGQFQRFPLL